MACPLDGLSDELGMWDGLRVVMVEEVWLSVKSGMQSRTIKSQYCYSLAPCADVEIEAYQEEVVGGLISSLGVLCELL